MLTCCVEWVKQELVWASTMNFWSWITCDNASVKISWNEQGKFIAMVPEVFGKGREQRCCSALRKVRQRSVGWARSCALQVSPAHPVASTALSMPCACSGSGLSQVSRRMRWHSTLLQLCYVFAAVLNAATRILRISCCPLPGTTLTLWLSFAQQVSKSTPKIILLFSATLQACD